MADVNIVVIGAGVSGLTTALLLAKNRRNKVAIVAKHMPGDYDIEYTSPWAGANYSPFAKAGTITASWEHQSWQPLAHLAAHEPEAGIHFQKNRAYNRKKNEGSLFDEFSSPDPWFKNTVPDFRVLSPEELPEGIDSGTEHTSVCINTALYLPYLVGQCRKHGVVLERRVLSHVAEAGKAHPSGQEADVVINCTGLLASRLGGVNDKTVVPARGQTIIVRNSPGYMYGSTSMEDKEDELAYCMERASGGGTVLGGSFQLGNWESQPDLDLAVRIMKNAVALNPGLTGGKGIEGLSIVRHAVGLRPYRAAGIRLEKEKIDGLWVVHNYGHAGYGYQTSFGCSEAVVKLVNEIVSTRAKL